MLLNADENFRASAIDRKKTEISKKLKYHYSSQKKLFFWGSSIFFSVFFGWCFFCYLFFSLSCFSSFFFSLVFCFVWWKTNLGDFFLLWEHTHIVIRRRRRLFIIITSICESNSQHVFRWIFFCFLFLKKSFFQFNFLMSFFCSLFNWLFTHYDCISFFLSLSFFFEWKKIWKIQFFCFRLKTEKKNLINCFFIIIINVLGKCVCVCDYPLFGVGVWKFFWKFESNKQKSMSNNNHIW